MKTDKTPVVHIDQNMWEYYFKIRKYRTWLIENKQHIKSGWREGYHYNVMIEHCTFILNELYPKLEIEFIGNLSDLTIFKCVNPPNYESITIEEMKKYISDNLTLTA